MLERESAGSKKILAYTALGDSLTAGVGKPFFSPGFVQLFSRKMEEELDVRVKSAIFDRSGATSEQVLESIVRHPYIQMKIKESDMITISAGGNDFINAVTSFLQNKDEGVFSAALDSCIQHLKQMIHEIIHLKTDEKSIYMVRLLNLYNPFPNEPLAVKWIAIFDSQLSKFSINSHVKVAPLHKAFAGREEELLAKDRIHPNGKGYEVIAASLAELGFEDWNPYE